jgi:hypothetical protein
MRRIAYISIPCTTIPFGSCHRSYVKKKRIMRTKKQIYNLLEEKEKEF